MSNTTTDWLATQFNTASWAVNQIQIHSKDRQLIAMLKGQITLLITTTWPYVAVMIYTVLTKNIPPSNKSTARNAIEAFALTFSTSFFLYLFNAVSVGKANLEILV
ncbi:unnamed protein product [Rotaria sp. Silwood2]|nr:unnamed protein product [Rotaria sp. Silwood2]